MIIPIHPLIQSYQSRISLWYFFPEALSLLMNLVIMPHSYDIKRRLQKPIKPKDMKISISTGAILIFMFSSLNCLSQDELTNKVSGKVSRNRTTTIWTGNINSSWTEPGNWNNGIPDISINVIIPASRPSYPILDGSLGIDTSSVTIPYSCASLILAEGAGITLDASSADLHNKGQIDLEGSFHVADDIILHNGSILNITHEAAEIKCGLYDGSYGKTFLYEGSTVNQYGGDFFTEELHLDNGSQYNGEAGYLKIYASGSIPATQGVTIDDPDSYFFHVYIAPDVTVELVDSDYDWNCEYNSMGAGFWI